jgi:transposase
MSVLPQTGTVEAKFGCNVLLYIALGQFQQRSMTKAPVAAQQFCEFLRRLVIKAEKPIFLILDGHPVHRSAKVKNLVESIYGKLQIYFLPPYSPELNPDEHVWNDLKNNGIGRMLVAGADDMRRKVISHLKFLQRNPVLIQSFFHAPTTAYAA